MSTNRYQITVQAGETRQTIMAGLTWQEASKELLSARNADIDYALASLSHSGTYSFQNERGDLAQIVLHKQPM